MPQENLEEEGLPKNPDLQLAQSIFLLSTKKYKNDASIAKKIMDKVIEDNMAPFYETVCIAQLGFKLDENLLKKMKETNEKDLKAIDEKIEDAEKNLGETEVRDFMLEKAEYLSRIGDKEGALTQFQKTSDKTVTLGYRLDLVFHLIRIGLFYMDHELITRYLEKAQTLIDEGGDWDRRNRLKVYRGVYCMSIRDFKKAASLFLDTVATFTSYELMDYQTFVTYTVFCCTIALERPKLREQVIKGSEILEVLHSLPNVKSFLFSLYDCQYASFFRILAWVEETMQYDRLLSPHYRYYIREMRIVAYSQLLESYRSLTLAYMAETFGVTVEFIDQELSRFIAAGRLHCKIDKVGGIVETNRPDSKNWQYQATIRQGDILLNRVQKLSRVINI
ncbi:26S proteasome non-ATPase regulatory subunit 6 isoform X1 [Octopus bimaculoides]|uniref:26S proteasome non-ATPase regulatory subunit 6 n=1 Tax=Octopus bimaculoides TaxID=37653 RepID=A0A0L8GBS0_OCTBM|nr:26S proteasome non-ATPase regulatory subunit 6 isoform X1 [Octopus bimaculoides]|eukprot:XP_014782448.1 PREDICTED: 26S proteasome non-ATPase regulatory subunit 6-like isoform X1 [Octopus bimaculoides]